MLRAKPSVRRKQGLSATSGRAWTEFILAALQAGQAKLNSALQAQEN